MIWPRVIFCLPFMIFVCGRHLPELDSTGIDVELRTQHGGLIWGRSRSPLSVTNDRGLRIKRMSIGPISMQILYNGGSATQKPNQAVREEENSTQKPNQAVIKGGNSTQKSSQAVREGENTTQKPNLLQVLFNGESSRYRVLSNLLTSF